MPITYVSFVAMLLLGTRGANATQKLYRDVETGAIYDDQSERSSPKAQLHELEQISVPEAQAMPRRSTQQFLAPVAQFDEPRQQSSFINDVMQAGPGLPAPQFQLPYMPASQSMLKEKEDVSNLRNQVKALNAQLELQHDQMNAQLHSEQEQLNAQLKAEHEQQHMWEDMVKQEKKKAQQQQSAFMEKTHKVVQVAQDAVRRAGDQALKEAKYWKEQAQTNEAKLKLAEETEKAEEDAKKAYEAKLKDAAEDASKEEELRKHLEVQLAAAKDAAKFSKQSLERQTNASMAELKKMKELLRSAETKAHAADERSQRLAANARIAVGQAEGKVKKLQLAVLREEKMMAAEVQHAKADAHDRIQKAEGVLRDYGAMMSATQAEKLRGPA